MFASLHPDDRADATVALRRRFMLAAVRLAQPADPARLNDSDLFDLYAMVGEPDFTAWRAQVQAFDLWRARQTGPTSSPPETVAAPASFDSSTPPTPREFDAQLRRQRG